MSCGCIVVCRFASMATFAFAFLANEPIEVGMRTQDQGSLRTTAAKDLPSGHRKDVQAEALLEKGRALEKRGAIDEAVAVYERLIREFPTASFADEVGEGVYSDEARERLKVIRCLKSRGHDFSMGSREELEEAIRKGFESKRINALAAIASCGFGVGKSETEAVWLLSPNLAIPVLVSLGPQLNWSEVEYSVAGVPFIPKDGKRHFFELQETSGRWKWIGYYTTQDEIVDILWKAKQEEKNQSKVQKK